MMTDRAAQRNLEDTRIPVQLRLSAAWGALMFLYIYADYIGLFRPGMIEDIMGGEVWVFQISQAFLLAISVMMSIPAVMVFLSVALRPALNRPLNIGVAAVFIFIAVGAAIGETYAFYYYFTAVEIVLLSLIVRYAWTWPVARQDSDLVA